MPDKSSRDAFGESLLATKVYEYADKETSSRNNIYI